MAKGKITLFNHILEFKLKKKQDHERIRLIVDTLFKELESQGYSTRGVGVVNCGFISLHKHDNGYNVSSNSGTDLTIPFNKVKVTK